jgi:hypothetical protein
VRRALERFHQRARVLRDGDGGVVAVVAEEDALAPVGDPLLERAGAGGRAKMTTTRM